MASTISSIIRDQFSGYSRCHKLPLHQHKAAAQIAHCGHSELGGHLERCPCGQAEQIVWHSCHHRLCPRCAAKARDEWLDKESERLLPCAHHHIIFTFPHELLALWRYNRSLMADVLFQEAGNTLKELLLDPKYLGATPGILLALHTWSRSIALHPHIHALITDGGLCEEEWIAPRRSCFLPVGVVKALFKGKFLARLRDLLKAGGLNLPPDCSAERLKSLINRLGRTKWHVWLTKRYDHGQGVLTYLARYLRGGPLRDSQISCPDAQHIQIHYQSHASDKPECICLTNDQWMQRYLEHAPITGQHGIRRLGCYAAPAKNKREQARKLLKEMEPCPQRKPSCLASHPRAPEVCPICHKELIYIRDIPAQRGPPC